MWEQSSKMCWLQVGGLGESSVISTPGDQAPVCCACLSVPLCPCVLELASPPLLDWPDPGVPDLKKLGAHGWLLVLAETVWVVFFLKQLVQ